MQAGYPSANTSQGPDDLTLWQCVKGRVTSCFLLPLLCHFLFGLIVRLPITLPPSHSFSKENNRLLLENRWGSPWAGQAAPFLRPFQDSILELKYPQCKEPTTTDRASRFKNTSKVSKKPYKFHRAPETCPVSRHQERAEGGNGLFTLLTKSRGWQDAYVGEILGLVRGN